MLRSACLTIVLLLGATTRTHAQSPAPLPESKGECWYPALPSGVCRAGRLNRVYACALRDDTTAVHFSLGRPVDAQSPFRRLPSDTSDGGGGGFCSRLSDSVPSFLPDALRLAPAGACSLVESLSLQGVIGLFGNASAATGAVGRRRVSIHATASADGAPGTGRSLQEELAATSPRGEGVGAGSGCSLYSYPADGRDTSPEACQAAFATQPLGHIEEVASCGQASLADSVEDTLTEWLGFRQPESLHVLEGTRFWGRPSPAEEDAFGFNCANRAPASSDAVQRLRHPPLQAPYCTVDSAALAPDQCFRLECKSLVVQRHAPTVRVAVSHQAFDVVAAAALVAALLTSAVRPLVARNKLVQFLLAGVFGVAVLALFVIHHVVNAATDTRLGKIGVGSVFAVGGASGVLQGIASTVAWWIATELRTNGQFQLAAVVASIVATGVCYWLLGKQLSWVLQGVLLGLQLGFFGYAWARNRELVAGVMVAYLCVVVSYFWLAVVMRLAGLRRFIPTFGLFAKSDPDAPRDTFPTHALREASFHKPRAETGVSGRSAKERFAAYDEQGAAYTRMQMEALHAHIRANPGEYTKRVTNPNELMRAAGVTDE